MYNCTTVLCARGFLCLLSCNLLNTCCGQRKSKQSYLASHALSTDTVEKVLLSQEQNAVTSQQCFSIKLTVSIHALLQMSTFKFFFFLCIEQLMYSLVTHEIASSYVQLLMHAYNVLLLLLLFRAHMHTCQTN